MELLRGALRGLLGGPEGFSGGLGRISVASWGPLGGVLGQHRRDGELLCVVLGLSRSLLAASWCFLGALWKHSETAVKQCGTAVTH